MEILMIVGKLLLVALAVAIVAHPLILERRNYDFVLKVYKLFRFKLFLQAFAVLAAAIFVGVMLYAFVPVLRIGWLSLFFDGGGNILIRPVQEGSESSSRYIRLLPILFYTALMFVLPFMAKAEEDIFRKGHHEWPSIIGQSVKFGLIHSVAGIPLAVCLALILAGLFYGWVYKNSFDRNVQILGRIQAEEEAVMASTVAHSMYNAIIVSILLIFAFVAV